MTFKKGEVSNPGGSSNIREISKLATGPKTREGKIRATLHNMSSGKYSKLIAEVRNCEECPLGERINKVKTSKGITEIKIPAQCPYFKREGNNCFYKPEQFIQELKLYYELIDSGVFDADKTVKYLAMKAAMDSDKARAIENATKGTPGFYTDLHGRRAIEAGKVLNEMKRTEQGTKINMEVKQVKTFSDVLIEVEKEVVAEVVSEKEEENDDR